MWSPNTIILVLLLTPGTLTLLLRTKIRLGELREPRGKAYPQQTPHSGRHYSRGLPKRFTEGWYYRLTLPEGSFAFILSVEDPHRPRSDVRLACIQVIGPHDEYMVQASRDVSQFWAWKEQQGVGCVFDSTDSYAMQPEYWNETVQSGFQVLPNRLQGRVEGWDGTVGDMFGGDQPVPRYCEFDFEITPLCGWGDTGKKQRSTGGWLSSFSVFEPHWQVTLADARATGRVIWQDQVYEFADAPFYAEKNWGAALPKKWYWTQCNSFDSYPQLSVTAGGGIRDIPFGRQEALGMVSIHYNGTLYQAVPWTGSMDWEVSTWGSWRLKGRCDCGPRKFDVVYECSCNPEAKPGLVFRAPTYEEGMVRFCRDTFEANTTLSLWELEWDSTTRLFVRKTGPPLIDNATSTQGGAEVGGGPWWDEWKGRSRLKQPIRFLLRVPVRTSSFFRWIRRKQ